MDSVVLDLHGLVEDSKAFCKNEFEELWQCLPDTLKIVD